MNPFSFHVSASNYRRRPSVRFVSHCERSRRRERALNTLSVVFAVSGFVAACVAAWAVLS